MKMKILVPALLLSVAVVMPASANWFNNPDLGISRNVGSAPNPTPEDIRLMRRPTISGENRTPILNMIATIFRGRQNQQTQASNTPQR